MSRASTFNQLIHAYTWPGNRRPRGKVWEQIKWQEFQAYRRREERARRARGKLFKRGYEPDLPEGCAGCAIGKRWLWREDDALREQFEGGWSLEAMAAAHERTFGAIIARLEKLKYLRRAPFTPGQSQTVIYSFIGAKCAGKQPYAVYARINRNKQWREVSDAQG